MTLSDIELWWPHTHGTPAMHTASFTFEQHTDNNADISSNGDVSNGDVSNDDASSGDGATAALTAELHARVGIRTVETTVDPVTAGRMFHVNGERIFIEGNNWKRLFCAIFILKTIFLPRQARDKHREIENKGRFLPGIRSPRGYGAV